MHRFRFATKFLEPSLLSGATCATITLLFLGVVNWAFLAHNPALYAYFFGPYGVFTVLQHAPLSVRLIWHNVFGGGVGRNVLSYLFILLIALGVFTVLEGGSMAVSEASAEAKEMHNAQTQHFPLLRHDIWMRTISRMLTAAAWCVYSVVFVWIIVPFCVSETRFGIATMYSQPSHVGHVIVGVLILLVASHLHVVFIRLLALRLRVFGGTAVLLELEANH